jgi:hypothetical protein
MRDWKMVLLQQLQHFEKRVKRPEIVEAEAVEENSGRGTANPAKAGG